MKDANVANIPLQNVINAGAARCTFIQLRAYILTHESRDDILKWINNRIDSLSEKLNKANEEYKAIKAMPKTPESDIFLLNIALDNPRYFLNDAVAKGYAVAAARQRVLELGFTKKIKRWVITNGRGSFGPMQCLSCDNIFLAIGKQNKLCNECGPK